MEKKTPNSPDIIDSENLGCMFGFSGIFDFHHGRSIQKLLLNDGRRNKALTGAEQRKSKAEIYKGFDENYQHINKKHKKAKNGARIIEDQNRSGEMSSELSSHDKGFCNQIPLKHAKRSSSRRIKSFQLEKTGVQVVPTFKDQREVGKQTREKSLWRRVVKYRYVYANKGKKNLDPSKILEISKPDQNNTQNSQKLGISQEKSTISYLKRGELDIFVEAKKHLSERLRKVEMFEALLRKQTPRTLERILLSSPKHEIMDALNSKWEKNDSAVSAQMRFSPYGNSQLAYEKSMQTQKRTLKLDDSYMICDSSSRGDMKILEASQEQNSNDRPIIFKEKRCSERVRMEPPSENGILRFSTDLSSSSTVNYCMLQITSRDQDGEENPSPDSILQPYFMDDASSPKSSITESADLPLQPHHLDFDENPEISLRTETMDNETISDYIKKVYHTSQLDWNEFLVKGCSSESSCDQKLLYDCIKEVLVDLHQFYFLSFIKSEIQAVLTEENVVNIVMKEVEGYTIPRTTPLTLDQLMGKDIAESGKWVDIRSDTDNIAIEIVEEALEDTILEMILDIQTIYSAHFKGAWLQL